MKTPFLPHATALLVAVLLPLRAAAAESPSLLLQKGIYAEEVERNLDSAVKIYEQIAAESAASRAVVAQAQYRLAVCYQKQGKKEQAIKVLEELVQQPPTDGDMSKNARETLTQLGVTAPATVSIRRVPLSGTPGWIVAVSRDGRLAAFQPRDSNELVVQDLATGKVQIVDKDAQMWGHSPPARFSPDGQWIGYDYQEAGIHVAKTDGSEVRVLFAAKSKDGKDHWNEFAGWSADGTQVIMAQWDNARACRVAVALDVKTSAAHEIAPAPNYREPDQWNISDDGRYVARRGGDYHRSISLMDFKSGHEETVLDHDADRVIGWVFGDTQLVYTKNEIHGVEIWAVKVQGGKTIGAPRLVSSDSVKSFSRGASGSYPLGVTRDGRIFYTVQREKPAACELWVLDGFLPDNPSDLEAATVETEIPSDELVVGVDHSLLDRKFGFSAMLPTGWALNSAVRRSNGGNGISLRIDGQGNSVVTIGYRSTTPWLEGPVSSGPDAHLWGPKKPESSEVDAWLRDYAEFGAHRLEQLKKDYLRDPAGFVARVVGGNKALSWSGSFTKGDEKWTDIRVLVYSEKAHAMINLQASAASMAALRPAFESFVESLRLP